MSVYIYKDAGWYFTVNGATLWMYWQDSEEVIFKRLSLSDHTLNDYPMRWHTCYRVERN